MTEEEILRELARLHRAVEEKVRRRQRGELFDRVDAGVDILRGNSASNKESV
jgi:hypothetical protein